MPGTSERIIVPGPAGFHPPSAAQLGVALPDPGQGLYYGLLELNEDKVIEEMGRELDKIPGIETSFSQPIRDNVLESISQIDGQIVVKLFGDDSLILRTNAQTFIRGFLDVPGVSRAFIDRAGEVPQSLIEIDRDRAARYGLNVLDIEDVIETGLPVEEGLRIILSAGTATPARLPRLEARALEP